MERLTRKSKNTDMIWFVDHNNKMDLEPSEMNYTHIRSVIQRLAYYEDNENNMKKEITAQWVIPVTREPWRKGFYGMCTNCNYINNHIENAPNFCEECGATMLNHI